MANGIVITEYDLGRIDLLGPWAEEIEGLTSRKTLAGGPQGRIPTKERGRWNEKGGEEGGEEDHEGEGEG